MISVALTGSTDRGFQFFALTFLPRLKLVYLKTPLLEDIFRLPLESFSIFRYVQKIVKNGKTILTAAEFTDELRNKLYKLDRDSTSMALELSTGRV